MKKFLLAFIALAAALAITPAAVADTWQYTIDGSNFTSTLYLTGTDVGQVPGPNPLDDVNAYVITSVSGSLTDPDGTYKFGTTTTESAASGSNAYDLTSSSDGQFLFDNLLYPSLSGNQILDWGGILFELGTYELNIFGGDFGGTDGNDAPGCSYCSPTGCYFYFADNGSYHYNDPFPDVTSPTVPALSSNDESESLTLVTPEPGSLFLLCTGLFGLAFVLWRRASRQSSGQILNA